MHDDGVRLVVNGTERVKRWYQHGATSPAFDVPEINLTAGQTIPIRIDWYNNDGPATLMLAYQFQGQQGDVPTDWLSVGANTLPSGWSTSVADGSGAQYATLITGSGGVTLRDVDGVNYEYRYVDPRNPLSGFTRPNNDNSTVIAKSDGTYLVEGDDGLLYTFGTAGQLTSLTSMSDDKRPSAPSYEFDSSETRVTAVIDPVSNRRITLKYSTEINTPCQASDTGLGFDAYAPFGMLCRIDYWDGTNTRFHFKDKKLARIQDPGDELTDFAYNVNGKISKIRNELQSDWVARDPANRDNDATRSLLTYDTANRVQTVSLPSTTGSSSDAQRQSHSYTYDTSKARVNVAGVSPPQGFYGEYEWDSAGRTTRATDSAGIATTTTYNSDDLVTSTTNMATNRKSTPFTILMIDLQTVMVLPRQAALV